MFTLQEGAEPVREAMYPRGTPRASPVYVAASSSPTDVRIGPGSRLTGEEGSTNVKIRCWVSGLVVAGLGLGLAGCTSTSATTSPSSSSLSPTNSSGMSTPPKSVTPTPTSTWNASQSDAVAAVEGYYVVSAELGADPSAFTKAQMAAKLKHYLGGDMIAANVGYFQKLQRRGLREMGASKTVSTTASEVINNHNSRGLEVHVTVCADQTGITVVDKAGEKASDEYQPPAFNLRQFSVRKPQGAVDWLVFGMETVHGECGP